MLLGEASAPTAPDRQPPPAGGSAVDEAEDTLITPTARHADASSGEESGDEEEDPETAHQLQIERARVLEAAGVVTRHPAVRKRRQAPAPPPSSKSATSITDEFVDAPETPSTAYTADEDIEEDGTDDAYARYLRL